MKKSPLPDTIWTYQDYCKLPPDPKRRIYQIIGGSLTMVPSPSFPHQNILIKIIVQLGNHVKQNDAGTILSAPMDVKLSETDVVQPDILFISKGRSEIISEQAILGAPDLVVEIQSPSTGKLDEVEKKSLYESCGVREYLIVYPREKKVLQYGREKGFFVNKGTFVTPDEVPLHTLEMSLNLMEIFG